MAIEEIDLTQPAEQPRDLSLSERRGFAIALHMLLPDDAPGHQRRASRKDIENVGGSDPDAIALAHEWVGRIQNG